MASDRDPEPSGGEGLLPAGPLRLRWAPVSALVSLAAALPGGDMSVASVPHCRMDVLLFPVGRRERTLALNFVIRTTEIPVPRSYPESKL